MVKKRQQSRTAVKTKRTKSNDKTVPRAIAAGIIVLSLALSIFFSFSSFTGYVTAEEVDLSANVFAIIFFLAGVAGAFFLLRE